MEKKMIDRPHPSNPNAGDFDAGKYVRMNQDDRGELDLTRQIENLTEENKKLQSELATLKSKADSWLEDLRQAEVVRIKLVKENERLSEIVEYSNDRIRKFNNGI
jgi:predicted site-specific integrase-resolvase